MRQLWELVAGFLETLWDTGNFYIRLAIVLILGWPVVLALAILGGIRGDAAIALALVPAVALVLLLMVIPPMLPVLVLAVPSRPFRIVPILGRIQIPSRAERLRTLKRILKALTLIAGIETAIGTYLAIVPVWKDPGLLLWLAAVTVAFVLAWYGGIRHRWLTRAFVISFLVITAIFFFGGRRPVRRAEAMTQAGAGVSQVQVAGAARVEEFTINAGEEIFTVLVGAGTHHRIQANKPWLALSRDDQNGTYEGPGGKYRPEGHGTLAVWNGAGPEAPLLIRGLEDGTKIRFERIER